ncbi:ccr4-not transcription complex subunit 10 isoform x4 [Stylonychia lemnae]|uniref:Ccr4-not transcription complex subunit 10 isoform x4 n=1 Tax=Stylonychia lemnae TaxID=5949 RepID=A0A078AW26_STYLE|nr:ccr4-not transcription complex subunit 10 isoform x4 [Stylonychia lemnae]|eukprot:CDW85417.1 ccr4-not transcription complex subunit 10 isoform x4 [Stylonychia lemnae]
MSQEQHANLGSIEQVSSEDVSQRAFETYQKSNFKETQKMLDKLKTNLEKDSRYQQNLFITEYYANKCKFPQKYLSDMVNLAQDMVQITKAPVCSIKAVQENGLSQQLVQFGNLYQTQINPPYSSPQQYNDQTQGIHGQNTSGGVQHRTGTSTIQKSNNQSSSNDGVQGFPLSLGEVNPVLLYNIAALSYQLQQYGKSLSYLIEILKNLEQVEEFLMIKSLFLMLQILYELRQPASSWPIIAYLELKLREFSQIIQQKQLIRNFQHQEDQKSNNQNQEESKSEGSGSGEQLDESVLNKNSFCIVNSSYLRKHAISPKNMNIHEYKFLLHSYKAIFMILQDEIQLAQAEIKLASELKDRYGQDPVKVKTQINVLAMVQHLGMVNNLKAQIYFKEGNYLKCIKTLTLDEKPSSSPHPSCKYQKHSDDQSKNDSVYQKCQNSFPHYYFNNLGIVHLKLQKYNLAIFYFSKALKYVEKSQNGQPTLQFDQENPNEHISHLNTQKVSEILYNYGLALFKVQRYQEAFRCFEKASLVLRHHPRTSQHKRFVLNQQGDPLKNQESLVSDYDQTQLEKLKQQQQEILKSQNLGYQQKQTKAQQKKEKLAQQQKQSQVNMPPDSMSLQSSIMYLQNALMGIEEQKNNEINYSMYIKFILRQQNINYHINNERVSATQYGSASGVNQTISDSLSESTDAQSILSGEESSSVMDFPQNQQELIAYKQFTVMQYIAEAHSMLGQYQQALECLKLENVLDNEVRLKVDNLANSMSEENPITSKIIQQVNICAIQMSAGNMDQAKLAVDQVLETLELKLQTTEMESKYLLPSYLINLLIYFYMKTKPAVSGQISIAQKSRNKSKTMIRNFS